MKCICDLIYKQKQTNKQILPFAAVLAVDGGHDYFISEVTL